VDSKGEEGLKRVKLPWLLNCADKNDMLFNFKSDFEKIDDNLTELFWKVAVLYVLVVRTKDIASRTA